jgi:hypothetical protein
MKTTPDFNNMAWFDFMWFYERMVKEVNEENSQQEGGGNVPIQELMKQQSRVIQ